MGKSNFVLRKYAADFSPQTFTADEAIMLNMSHYANNFNESLLE